MGDMRLGGGVAEIYGRTMGAPGCVHRHDAPTTLLWNQEAIYVAEVLFISDQLLCKWVLLVPRVESYDCRHRAGIGQSTAGPTRCAEWLSNCG